MEKELRDRWVAALRSGEYKQGKSALRRDGKYCCLGVLREIIHPGCHASKWNKGQYLSTVALRSVRFGERIQITLGEMNDHGSTFSEIADYIEANL